MRSGYISGISLEEFLQVNLLRVVMKDQEFTLREDITYAGSIYDIESRIRNITLPELPSRLRERI